MNRLTKVDFHIHSNLSDGYFSPEALASKLSAQGIYYAALTDHDSFSGLARFQKAAKQLGIVTVTGVELFSWHNGIETHILAYGFDIDDTALSATLSKPKQAAEVIKLIHEAGGKAFLAHPYHFIQNHDEVENVVEELTSSGLDGIEVYYNSHSEEQKQKLQDLADKHSLLTSGGSDFHGTSTDETEALGCEMPREKWSEFRTALTGLETEKNNQTLKKNGNRKPVFNWGGFYLRTVLPAFSAIALFIAFIFLIILPTISDSLLERKREMIRELTNSAWSILVEYDTAFKNGELGLEEAQEEAVERIRYLRYGSEGKDYFWITDEHPRMIMHPYRSDLDGTDLTSFADPDGVRLFVEFVNIVERNDHGYVEYVWQWKDDPERLEAKESYVRGFEPWGWVIGTGLYMEDVNAEIRSITNSLIGYSLFIVTAVGLLMWFVILQSLRSERKRNEFERDLRISQEKYRTLAEAATEGTLVVSGERCIYANKLFLNMLDYSEEEMAFLELVDLIPDDGNESRQLQNELEELRTDKVTEIQIETDLLRKDGHRLPLLVTARKASFALEKAIIISVADIARHKKIELELDRSQFKYKTLTENINLGVFRILQNSDGSFVELNSAGRKILTGDEYSWPEEGLRHYFLVGENFNQLMSMVRREKTVKDSIQLIRNSEGKTTTISLSLVLVADNNDSTSYCDGIMEDVSEQQRIESDRERTLSQLQTSLLFLNEPVSNFMQDLPVCTLQTEVGAAALLMSDHAYTALGVADSDENVIGLVTDKDLRARVVAENLDHGTPVYEIMTSPIVSIPDNALVYEAFLNMREKHIRHLPLKNSDGRVVGIVRSNDMFRFDRYSPVILTREINDARDVSDLVRGRERLSPVVSSLVTSGVNPASICRTVTTVTDAIVEKTITFAIEKLGPPPTRFAFVAMGSEGREEQTLLTDQDNAIIYEDLKQETAEAASEYFLKLGEMISPDLATIGYTKCPGDIMASNPDMNMPLAGWEKSFRKWIKTPDAEQLLQFNILFDFRCVYGDETFTQELRKFINDQLKNQPPFFLHLARNTLLYKPPLGLLGQIVTESSGDSKHNVNIKDAMMPVVNFARLYALKHNIEATNTLDRLKHLRECGELRDDNHRELRQAYNYMMQLRFKHQTNLINANKPLNNLIPLKSLSQLEISMLKRAFGEINLIQKKVSFDYLGQA